MSNFRPVDRDTGFLMPPSVLLGLLVYGYERAGQIEMQLREEVAKLTVAALAALPKIYGASKMLLADTGYLSLRNVNVCAEARIEPLIARARQKHNPKLEDRYAADPPAPADPTAIEAMGRRLKTKAGMALYALRKQTPVFGNIKRIFAVTGAV